ncbi:hypothetical protein N0V93_002107 [Gnomoniopsis smithogilvyi]|uniref:Uncharacterized protein n=1 Tax=Gnomoniopsis smithogilvyi TaxID=1191159 RepID=A0A9W8Z547_9PEZI|nr:hypothetical protein N0V93_002107 [Gnomoniopsis smithogilvyi]
MDASNLITQSRSKLTATSAVIDLTTDVNDDGTFSKTIQIDPYGDLKLIAGEDKTLLYGAFAEAKPSDGRDWRVKLPEDHPGGLEVILNLIHWPGQPAKLPKVDINLAFEVAVLTNK